MSERIHLEQHDLQIDSGEPLHYAFGAPRVGAEGSPLVLGLHFGWQGEQPRRMGRDFLRLLVEPGLGQLGAVLVGPTCPERTWHHPRSEGALLALLDHVQQRHATDPARVVVVGFSLGGMGAWYLGANHPGRFAHCVPMATLPVVVRGDDGGLGIAEFQRVAAGGEVSWRPGIAEVGWSVIHSRSDELVPWQPTQRAVDAMRARGADVRLDLLEKVGHYESVRYTEALRALVPRIRASWTPAGATRRPPPA